MIQIARIKTSAQQQIVPFQPNHLNLIDFRKHELDNIENIPDYLAYVINNSIDDLTWTGIAKGKVICIFGIRPMWTGVAEAWLLTGHGIEQNAISLVRGARILLSDSIEEFGLKRLQIAVRVSNETAFKFAQALHFKVESKMKKFGPEGEDYYLMTRIS